MDLSNKTAIITGATGGIGAAAAQIFAEAGANLVLGGRREDRLDNLKNELSAKGAKVVCLVGDVTEEQHAKQLVAAAISTFGGLDVAFNNAGTLGKMGDVASLARADWDIVVETNLTSAFLAAKHQVPALLQRKGSSLVFTSSFVGHTAGLPGLAAYAASKAGLIGLVQTLAAEYGPKGLRVNALLPGGTMTEMLDAFGSDPQTVAAVSAIHALGRLAEPEEIAKAALFLASDASSFVTGSAMLVEGGNSVRKF